MDPPPVLDPDLQGCDRGNPHVDAVTATSAKERQPRPRPACNRARAAAPSGLLRRNSRSHDRAGRAPSELSERGHPLGHGGREGRRAPGGIQTGHPPGQSQTPGPLAMASARSCH
eukprot:4274741-Alexandrium_andersonii.AAC.1